MKDYNKGKIYKIVNDVNDKFYVGSTVQPLHKRMGDHRRNHKDCMSKNIGVDLKECSIILIQNYPCKDKPELLRKEREYFDKYKKECKEVFLNKYRPIRLEGEKNGDKEKRKEWREKNKEKVKKKAVEWEKNNKEKISKRKKEYYQKNKEKINKQAREYYQKNKQSSN